MTQKPKPAPTAIGTGGSGKEQSGSAPYSPPRSPSNSIPEPNAGSPVRQNGEWGAAMSDPSRHRFNHAANPGRHRLKDRGDDLNETPVKAVHALLKVERLPNFIWEPCCGPGAMVKVLREAGHRVLATDLVDYGCPDSESRIDFLMEWRAPDGVEAIVSNFPYKLANQFVPHALKLVPLVISLHRLAFLECKRRSAILDGGQLARVHVFIERLPMMHRKGWTGNRIDKGSMAFAWFVWDRNHIGPATIDRISSRFNGGGNV